METSEKSRTGTKSRSLSRHCSSDSLESLGGVDRHTGEEDVITRGNSIYGCRDISVGYIQRENRNSFYIRDYAMLESRLVSLEGMLPSTNMEALRLIVCL
ncbi:hypothetical protein TMatcc_001895 [Talaromyces marneffei ATCC 18224]